MLPFHHLLTTRDQRQKTKGFTLIEMLVVIAIISILIGIGVNTFTIAQKKARDTKRQADLTTLQKALEAYQLDHKGNYPSTGGTFLSTCDAWEPPTNDWIPELVAGGYIAKLPQDPLRGTSTASMTNNGTTDTTTFCYVYSGVGTNYVLISVCGIEGTPITANHPLFMEGNPWPCDTTNTSRSYTIHSPNYQL